MRYLVTPTKAMGYSDICLDLLAGSGSARRFFSVAGIDKAAVNVDGIAYDREKISAILTRQNRGFGASDETLANIERLKEAGSSCVFAGQQAGLLGGPLLVFMKALGIVKAAELYGRQLRLPVIPVFWIAGDDHDFEEANHTFLLDRMTAPVRVSYATPPEQAGPMSEVTFGDTDELSRLKALVKETLGQTDFTGELYDLIERAYSPEDTFVTAFGKFMAALTRGTGLVLFSPGDAEVKRHALGLFRAILEGQDELHERLNERNSRIEEGGYRLQVEKKQEATHLFYNRDGRRPIMRHGDAFTVGDCSFSKGELLERLEREPEKFSPDVITRPVLQSHLFPVLCQRGGPAEMAYFAQVDGLFGLYGLTPPFYMVRPSATILEDRFAKLMREYHIEFGELAGDIELVVNRVLAHSFPGDIEKGFDVLREDIEFHITKFANEAFAFDPALEKFAEQTQGKIDYALKNFERKVFAAHKKKSNDVRERIYRLYNAVYTERGLQERSLNITYFLSRYGMSFVSYLYEQLDSEEKAHQVIDLTELSR